jgi:CHAD domain-containing protein
MAKARKVPGLEAETRFADAAAASVEVRAAEVFEHLDGVLDTGDIERVHDMRVATRRLRAVLEVFAHCFPKKEYKRVLREVKDLADALGARRDPDVAIASLERIATELGDEARPGVEGLADDFREEQGQGNDLLAAALDQVRETRLEERLAELAGAARAEAEAR